MGDQYVSFHEKHTVRSFGVFEQLNFVYTPQLRSDNPWVRSAEEEVMNLDEEKMMVHVLDCLAALAEKQRVRVASEKPLLLSDEDDAPALTAAQQAARNKVFKAALALVAGGLTHDGADKDEDERSPAVRQLAFAFPDKDKMEDGRGWLPLHWAVAASGEQLGGAAGGDVRGVPGAGHDAAAAGPAAAREQGSGEACGVVFVIDKMIERG